MFIFFLVWLLKLLNPSKVKNSPIGTLQNGNRELPSIPKAEVSFTQNYKKFL